MKDSNLQPSESESAALPIVPIPNINLQRLITPTSAFADMFRNAVSLRHYNMKVFIGGSRRDFSGNFIEPVPRRRLTKKETTKWLWIFEF